MTCIDPPPLSPDQLSALIDGVAEAHVTEHLARCPYCTERLAAARVLEQQLSGQLHRWDCPTPQQLVDFHLGMLGEDQAQIAAHTSSCPRCQAELAELAAFLDANGELAATPPPQPERVRRPSLRELIAQLLPRTPAMALRGEHAGPLVAQAGDIMVLLDIQAAGDTGLNVIGQLAAPDQDAWTGALAQVSHNNAVVHTAFVDDMGGFRFAGLAPAFVDLRITPPSGPAIFLPGLNVGGKARDS
jgi:anti-sigma factor RsiW